MSNVKEFIFVGFIPIIEHGPGFVTPIFTEGINLWIQEIDTYGYIVSFSRLEILELNNIIQAPPSNNVFYPADEAIYAFQLENRVVQFGTLHFLQASLEEQIDENEGFKNFPFLRIEILEFIGRKEEVSLAIKEAAKEIYKIDPEIADFWEESALESQNKQNKSISDNDCFYMLDQSKKSGGIEEIKRSILDCILFLIRERPIFVSSMYQGQLEWFKRNGKYDLSNKTLLTWEEFFINEFVLSVEESCQDYISTTINNFPDIIRQDLCEFLCAHQKIAGMGLNPTMDRPTTLGDVVVEEYEFSFENSIILTLQTPNPLRIDQKTLEARTKDAYMDIDRCSSLSELIAAT